jgi:glycosyltransferase involved in cell wall biosynthesis
MRRRIVPVMLPEFGNETGENTSLNVGISIAMCTYNGSRFLREQLNSIARQNRLPEELVVCDDRSTDDSVALVDAFSRTVPFPVRLSINETNLGATKNFERAISLCGESIIVLADQDDIWYSHKLQRIEQDFRMSDACVAVFSDADLIGQNSELTGQRLWDCFLFPRADQKRFVDGEALNILVRHPVVTGAAMAFRRSLFHLLAPFPSNDIHDQWMSFLLAACGPYGLIPEPLMRYRVHSNQLVGLGVQTFFDRWKKARVTGKPLYLSEINRFRQLYERIDQHRNVMPNAQIALTEIRRKISHLEHRVQMRQFHIGRMRKILREVRNHGYWRYASGWRSVAKDVLMYGGI